MNEKSEGMRWVSIEVGLFLLSLAFVLSFWFPEIFDQPWRLIILLEASPTAYLTQVNRILLFSILPVAVGLVFSVIGYVREIRSPTGVLGWSLPLAIFGFVFLFWGVFGLNFYRISYPMALAEAERYFVEGLWVKSSVTAIYSTAFVARIIWIATGVLFMLSPIFKKITRRKQEKLKLRRILSQIKLTSSTSL